MRISLVLMLYLIALACRSACAEVVISGLPGPAGNPCLEFIFCTEDLFTAGGPSGVLGWNPAADSLQSIYQPARSLVDVRTAGPYLIAFREKISHPTIYGYKALRVIRADGTPIATITDEYSVQEFSWSPSGTEIAFAVGDNIEGFGYIAKGLYVFHVASEKREMVSESGTSPHWASFDGNLYFAEYSDTRSGVYAYNRDTKAITKTDYHSTLFSTGGTYYYVLTEEPAPIAMYERKSNALVTERVEAPVPKLALARLNPNGWLDDRFFSANSYGSERSAEGYPITYVLDAETGRVLRANGYVVGGYLPGVVVVQKGNGSLALDHVESMMEVDPEELPKSNAEEFAEEQHRERQGR